MPDILTKWVSLDGVWPVSTSWSNGIPNTTDHIASFERGVGVAPTTGLDTTDEIKELRIHGFKHDIGGPGNFLKIGVTLRVSHAGFGRLYWKYYEGASSNLVTNVFIESPNGADIDSNKPANVISANFFVTGGRVVLYPDVRIASGSFGGVQAGDGPGLIVVSKRFAASVFSQALSLEHVFVDGTFHQTGGAGAPLELEIVKGEVVLISDLLNTNIWQYGGRCRWVPPTSGALERLYCTGGLFDATTGAPDPLIKSGLKRRPGRVMLPAGAGSGIIDLDLLSI